MISSILWKEYREHRVVWAALAVVGAALLLVLPAVMAPGGLDAHPRAREAMFVAAAVLAWIYGVVCGGLLLAGERETGTLPFLDALPGWRGRLWRAKCLVGVLLALAQAAVLAGASAAAGLMPAWTDAAWLLSWLTVAGLFGLGWGLLFSAFGRNAMNVILLSLPVQLGALCFAFLAGYVVGAVAALVVGVNLSNLDEQRNTFMAAGMIGVAFLIGVAALTASARIFTRQDRARLRAARPSLPRRRGLSWSAPLWLTWRQARGFAAGLAVFALLLGLMILVQPVLLWPMATLLIGVLCGATAFMDEQEGPYRFLGDQRFPLGRLWLVKVGVRFAIAVATALIVLAPSFVIALSNSPFFTPRYSGPYLFFTRMFGSNLIEQLCPPGVFLTVWLVTGFAAGCLCGLLFRSGLAAGVLALFTGVVLTAIWVPSMLGGGLHVWQALGPPILLLLSTRLLLRPWAAGRIASWTTAVRLTPFVVLALLWIAGGLWYRVLEIPYIPEKADLDAFRASLPTPEQNEGGELARRACLRFEDSLSVLRSEQPPPRQAVGPNGPNPPSPMGRVYDVLEHGWKADDAELAAWLDKLFAGEWVGMLKKAADLPPGMFDDLRYYTELSRTRTVDPVRDLAVVLAARGLQRQAAGDDEAYVEDLRIGLHLSQTLRHTAPPYDVVIGRVAEGILLHGLDHWLEKLKGRPDLLQKALGVLSRYLDATADDSEDQELVDDLILRNTIDDPLPWLQGYLSNNAGEYQSALGRAEAQWVALAWLTPWERERQDRILRIAFWGDKVQRRALYSSDQFEWLPQIVHYRNEQTEPIRQCWERAMLLKLALRWYQAENGKPADNLDELVPKYLPSIPTDPYDGKPFRYRLSKGEKIEWPEEPPPPGAGVPGAAPPGGSAPPTANAPGVPGAPPPPPATRTIPAGQGILWCVGADGRDDGGHRQTPFPDSIFVPGGDVIFLVPLPPKNN